MAAVLFLLSSPALAQSSEALKDCPPIGQTAKGDLVYSLDCKAIKADYKPDMPPTNMKETVIPKSGGLQTPETTQTKGEVK